MSENSRYISEKLSCPIICFSGTDWWCHNRALFVTQVMQRLAKETKVLYINSLGMRVPSLKDDPYALRKILRKMRSFARFLRIESNGMYVMSPISLPLLGSRIGRAMNAWSVLLQVKLVMFLLRIRNPICYNGCPPAWEVIKRIKHRYLIYECTDLYEEMPGVDREYVREVDAYLRDQSNLVLYVSMDMYKAGLKRNRGSMLIGHGVDFDLFASAKDSDYVPQDIANVRRPIVGYFGDICDKTFDFDLLEHLAAGMPHTSFVLIGSQSSDVEGLRRFNNVHLLGQKPYEDIPHYGKVFDVSILPWKRNRWVVHSYPVKIKEYLALGHPFVCIDIPAIDPFSHVTYVAKDHDDFLAKLRQAVEDKDPTRRQERQDSVRNETWDCKTREMMEFIERDLGRKTST